ncbi:MAG TPA: hypothetical protein VFO06_01000 [Gemmatimonadales bacterium]|nr:hypothetical protein [Gemmatimonadales bacterium]
MLLEEAIASVTKLERSITMPTNDTDPANGVTGSVTVSWHLCPNSRYILPQRLPGSKLQGRCP